MMNDDSIIARYQELQHYVGWTAADAARVHSAGPLLQPFFTELIDDFYEEISRHVEARAVITGGEAQVARLKGTLRHWIDELFAGPYDAAYVAKRARVGLRHVDIGLKQIYANIALSRLRAGMLAALHRVWQGPADELHAVVVSLDRLLDLDLALIAYVYEIEHIRRLQALQQAEFDELLHREKQFSEGLLRSAEAIVLVVDLQGLIVRFNPYLEHLTGRRLEHVVGLDWYSLFFPPEDQERARRELSPQLSSEQTSTAATVPLVLADSRRDVRWTSTLLRDGGGRPVANLVIGQDITDLRAAQTRALQAERLAAIGQMATGLTHEARNALQRIQASAELLELEVEGLAEPLDLVHRIQNAQQQVARLFEEVRGYAAPVKLDYSPCQLSEVWREAWDLLATQRAGRQAMLCEDIQQVRLDMVIDRFRLVQVFRNCLENSLAACADPVTITIQCAPAHLHGRRAVRVAVRDNGPGLAPEVKRRIFEPFFTTKTKGTGLGMPIAQRLIEAHGGTLELGDPPTGAEIILTLPRVEP
jgi:PAS domain S-box-containing protein